VEKLTIAEESIDSSGALSVYHAAVDELNRRYGGEADTRHLLTSELKAPLGTFLVARLEGHPVGGVGVRPIGDPAAKYGEVKRLWVRSDLRRSGVAKRLMSEIEQWSRAAGYHGLYLETGPAQPEALAFYPRTGWLAVDEFPPGAFSHSGASRFMKDL
jgi:GNAT superfamily N-acetyltransferase